MTSLITDSECIVRVYKRALGNPSYVWSNYYEISWGETTPPGITDWPDLFAAFTAFEQVIHGPNVEFTKLTASSWEPGDPNRQFNDPDEFFTVSPPAATYGTRSFGGSDPLPRHVALHVTRQVFLGNQGKLFYRGALSELDMQSNSTLDARLTSAATTALDDIIIAAYETLYTALSALGGQMAMVRTLPGISGRNVRLIQGLNVAGISICQPNHAYFDRATP